MLKLGCQNHIQCQPRYRSLLLVGDMTSDREVPYEDKNKSIAYKHFVGLKNTQCVFDITMRHLVSTHKESGPMYMTAPSVVWSPLLETKFSLVPIVVRERTLGCRSVERYTVFPHTVTGNTCA